ncbi:RagB/SusD family nutrient uptake outer membrane protein [Chryseolinea lacunae]|uniref:RagB/SusD family nutrient uptake outer membrane protein n=1 Tax=Chryseolinea lacunae TaxID=2801331 RepID=A0ABS1KL84_9BACT|nr:RagB/SusD family nutrient uptake outer membrane protein [Chryseolinea lacunae]MBL0739993.1 RagB/SusD family nutrient uptake outer membrane protein [Chryseolinea lacunae]
MKNFRIHILTLLFVSMAFSCSEDLLDVDNPNTPTVDQAWKTEKDAEMGINAAYNMFYKPSTWTRWIYFRYDLTSDEGHSTSPWGELADWTRFRYSNYNFWDGNNWHWRDFYKAIFRTNQVLAYVPTITFKDEATRDKILAQAKFIRALFYFQVAVLWETGPIVLDPSEPADEPEQRGEAEIWAQVEEDLLWAADKLPPTWDDANVGRATKGAAKALLARAYAQQKKWALAKAQLDWLVTGEGKGYYGLVDNYRDNFTHLNENNKESVFEIQFSDKNKGGDGDNLSASMGFQRTQFFAPGGIGWQDGKARAWLIDEYKKEKTKDGKNDPRLLNNIFYKDAYKDFPDAVANDTLVYNRRWDVGAWGNETFIKKYSTYYYRDREDYHAPNNFRFIRYADVLLLYAECLNETDQTAYAYQYVNLVRERPGTNLKKLEDAYPAIGNDKTLFRKRLQMERSLELCFEAVRWMDLKRWDLVTTQAGIEELKTRDVDFNNFVLGKHHRLPIPQIEVDNNTKLDQNTPY